MRTPITPETAQIGAIIEELLYTDTRCWEIIDKTAKTITIRSCRRVEGPDGHPMTLGTWPHLEYAVTSNPDALTMRLRFRKDGTFRVGRWARPMYLTPLSDFPDGNKYPTEYRDWSF
jgi:hypothetical protein